MAKRLPIEKMIEKISHKLSHFIVLQDVVPDCIDISVSYPQSMAHLTISGEEIKKLLLERREEPIWD